MQAFAYAKPASVADAVRAITADDDAKLIAGGQSMLGSMKLGLATPSAVIDLGGIAEMKGITVGGGVVKIGAMTPHAEVAASKEVAAAIPALAALAGGIGDRQVRNRGTLGGSIANADPAACYPSAIVGLGATVHTDRRSIPGDQFFTGLYETALQPGEIVTAVSFPIPEKAAYVKFKQPASRFALVGVFVSKGAQGVRVAITGAYASVTRMAALEAALAASWTPAAAEAVKVSADGLNTDLHGSAAYRASLIPVLTGRAVAAA